MKAKALPIVIGIVVALAGAGVFARRRAAPPPLAAVAAPAKAAPVRFDIPPDELRALIERRYPTLLYEIEPAMGARDRLRELLLERQIVTVDTVNAATSRGLDPRADLATIRAQVAAAQVAVDQRIRTRFGEAFYSRYKAFEETQSQRNTVARLGAMLGASPTPLASEQVRGLVVVLTEYPADDDGGGIGRLVRGGINYNARITNEAIAAAEKLLSPPQLDALRRLREQLDLPAPAASGR